MIVGVRRLSRPSFRFKNVHTRSLIPTLVAVCSSSLHGSYSEERLRKKGEDTSSSDDDKDPDLEAPAFAVSKGDGVITLAEWYSFFDFLLGE